MAYLLGGPEGHTPYPTWDWFAVEALLHDSPARTVGKWSIGHVGAQEPAICVSTVFLAIPHPPFDDQHPMLFETMIFAPDFPDLNRQQWRAPTWEMAEHMHAAAVRVAQAAWRRHNMDNGEADERDDGPARGGRDPD